MEPRPRIMSKMLNIWKKSSVPSEILFRVLRWECYFDKERSKKEREPFWMDFYDLERETFRDTFLCSNIKIYKFYLINLNLFCIYISYNLML